MLIILGSQSPRRRELLAELGYSFRAITIDADEHYPSTLSEGEIPSFIARAKAEAYYQQLRDEELLITADTVVCVDGQVLGKPQDKEDAKRMLRLLSGRSHQVYTAVAFTTRVNGEPHTTVQVDRADVTFLRLTEEQIAYYVEQYQPLDKAGAYGIQEWIGFVGIESIKGSFYTVMGLPTHLVAQYLMREGV